MHRPIHVKQSNRILQQKTLLTTILVLFFGTTSSLANDTDTKNFFTQKVTKTWAVYGGYYDSKGDKPSCFAQFDWDDGSFFQIHKDLIDGEIFFFFKNYVWDIADPKGPDHQYSMKVIYTKKYRGNIEVVDKGDMAFYLSSKNSIFAPGLYSDRLLANLLVADTLTLIPDGDIPNAKIAIGRMEPVLEALSKCVTDYKVKHILDLPNERTNTKKKPI